MRLSNLLLIVVTASLPVAAGAVDVDFGAKVEGVYDSNVYRTTRDQKQDGSFRFTPTINIEVPTQRFTGSLYYAPTYEVFMTQSDANGLTHDVRNALNWIPDEKTEVSLRSRFQALDVLNFNDPDTIDEGTQAIPDNDISRQRVYLFGSALSIAHAISPRWNSNTSVDFNLFESERRLTSNSKGIAAFQNFEYGVTASDRVGGGGGVSVQFFDGTVGLPASNNYVYQLFASYSRNFGERTILSIRAGPALIHTVQDSFDRTSTEPTYPHVPVYNLAGEVTGVRVPDADTCLGVPNETVLWEGSRCAENTYLFRNDANPADPINATIDAIVTGISDLTLQGSNAGSNDMSWTIFGEVALTHFWLPTLTSTISYNRRESPSNGLGASSIADSVLFLTNWQPGELWDLSMRMSYVRRESPTNLSRTFLQVDGQDFGAGAGGVIVRSNSLTTVVEKSNSVDTHRWAVTMRAARRITRRISSSLHFSYTDQRSKHTSRNPNDFGNFMVMVGVEYDFDRIRF